MTATALAKLDPHGRAEYWAALALRHTKGLGARSIRQLLSHFGSAYDAVHQVARWSEARVSTDKGAALARDDWRESARPEWEDSRDLDGDILLWTDPRYPASLRELPDAPALLYCRGDISLLNNPCVGVVGSRICLPRSLTIAHSMSQQLAESGVTVVSGMARGIDYAAHSGALTAQGGTIAVLGSGLDIIYPPSHSDLYRALGVRGLLVSEFAPGTLPQGTLFPIRNRIISGLSLGIVVVEAAQRSGSLVTSRLALEQNRAVYAVPPDWLERGESNDEASTERAGEGCASLIEQGAKAVHNAAEVLADLAPLLRSSLTFAPASLLNDLFPTPVSTDIDPFPGLYAKVLRVENKERQDAQMVKDGKNIVGNTKTALAGTRAKVIGKAAAKPNPKSNTKPKLAPQTPPDSPETFVLDLLRQGPLHPDDILAVIHEAANGHTFLDPNMNAGSLSALLIMHEVRGAIRLLPGQMYSLP